MQTVVLAAGQGTRMRPLTDTTPKPMLPAVGRPLLEHTLNRAADAGASRFIVVVGYESQQVREHFGDNRAGLDIAYAEQTDQRGTADAVRAAAPHLDDDAFVVLNGDALYDPASLATLYESGPAVGSYRVDNPSNYGVLQLDGERRHASHGRRRKAGRPGLEPHQYRLVRLPRVGDRLPRRIDLRTRRTGAD
ncbi:MAG: nucleoside-diphosphate-sugar pyrophosphorylase [Halonotius sp. J07HN6]|nr:MAG: nucleoside-diphosphate-sugar pyrophosphorylase [Halonotius sp. J07HN6]